MKQKIQTIWQSIVQQRTVVLFVISISLFAATVLGLSGSLAANSERPVPPAPNHAPRYAPGYGMAPRNASNFMPTVRWAVAHGSTAAVSSLPVKVPKIPTAWKTNWPRRIKERQTAVTLPVSDSVQQTSTGLLAMAEPLGTFEGINQAGGCGNCIPPDATGAVGPNHYVEAVNSSFAVYSKSGDVLAGPTEINALFSALPGNPPCKQLNDGDPIILHDQFADRWLISQFTAGPDYHECIAISQTPNPTGAYHVYDFDVGGTTVFHDYPKLGVWPDAYYMSTNEFANGSSFIGAGAFAFERDKMVAGQPARMVFFDLSRVNSAFGGMLPSDLDGSNLPPAGSPNYFAEIDSEINTPSLGPDALRIWKFQVDWANPTNSTFGIDGQPNAVVPVATWNPPQCIRGVGTCPPQLGSPYQLDVLGDRLMFRLAYRNFGTHESLVVNHSVIADARIGVRWYEVRSPGTTPVIHQQSTFAPTDPLYRWMGSAGMDNQGNFAVAYSISSASTFPSIAYAGRLASDPLNALSQGEAQMWAGTGAQNVGFYLPPASRWGDYTTLSIDPSDDCTFWYVNQYYGAEGTTDPGAPWRTRIGSFKFPQCTAVAPPSPTPTPTPTPTATPTPTPTATPTPTPTPIPTPGGFSFSPSARVYDSTSTNAQTGGEPSLELDSSDRVYVAEVSGRLWRSTNAGGAWKFLGAFDPGGDADLEFDALNRLYASALVVGQGLTSTVNRYSTPATMNSVNERDFKTNTYPLNDRQWLATYGNDTVYLGFHDIGPENVFVTKSTNGGQSFGPPVPVITDPVLLANTIPNTNDGRVLTDKNTGAVYIAFAASYPEDNAKTPPFGPHRKIVVARSFDGGITWLNSVAFEGPPGTATGNIFPAFAIDDGGNLYVVFATNLDSNLQLTPTGTLNIFLTRSTDRGATWSVPVQVNSDVGSHVLPWAVAGCAGKVDIVWYGTNAVGNPNSFPASGSGAPDWHVYMAQTHNGFSSTPTFLQAQVSDHIVHKGQISTGGLLGSADRRLLDFFEVDYDSNGLAHIVWADTGTSATATAQVFYARQTGGSSIGGCPTGPPPPPVAEGTQIIEGTYDPHAYPCGSLKHRFTVAPGKSRIVVQVNAQVPGNDISVSLLFGSDPNAQLIRTEDTGTCCETLIYEPAGGVPAGEYQVQVCQTPNTFGVPQNPPFNYTGTFTALGSGGPSPAPTPTPTPTASPTPTPTPTPIEITPVYTKGGITFSPNVTVRASVTGRDGEPSLRVDKFGNAYVAGIRGVPAGVDLWYFDLNPNSPTYDPLLRNPIYRGQPDQFSPDESMEVGADGGGDVDLAVGFDEATPGSPPYLAFTSLVLANISAARSTDRGATFIKNPLGNVTGGVPVDDRQWMEFFGKDSVYLLYRTVSPVVAYVQRSNDGGLTYGTARPVGTIGQVGGISVDQNDGTVYVSGANGVVAVGVPPAPGLEPLTYTVHTVAGAGNNHIFFTVKAAKDGTVYACYSNGHTVFIRYSRDKGNTWSPAIRVSDGAETATSILPWIETGPTPGSIGVVWYGTTEPNNNDNANWKVFFAQSLNATDANPVFRQVEVSDHFIHGSNVSEAGLPITPGNAPNRNLLDYFQIAFDPTGAAVVAYTDDHNDYDGHTYVARQVSGPGIRGTDVPAPVEGSALPRPTPRAADAPQVVDFAQDHKNGLLTVLPVNDPLDILSVKYRTEPSANGPVLVATMKVSDLSTVPPLSNWRMSFTANAPDSRMSPTGDYTFGLSDRGDQFFVRATTDALGARTFTYGTAVREHQHRGFIAYTDRGAADSGSFDTANNTVTIKVALSKLNQTLAAGHAPLGPGSILVGLRGNAYTTGDDNAADRNDRAKSDITRGGIQYAINSPPTAVLTANPTAGTLPLNVNFDASGSTDPDAGEVLSYTFDFGDGGGPYTQNSPLIIHQYDRAGIFTATVKVTDSSGFESNSASVSITVTNPPPPPCIEDNDPRVAYSGGWHLINNANASDGHFRYHTGNSPNHSASLDFSVPAGGSGSITYSFAKSPKGGTADVYLDGVKKQTINYAGAVGATQAPEFKPEYNVQYAGLSPGAHKLEIKNMNGVVYVDRFCLESSSSSAQPAAGPGNTTNNPGSASAGQTASSNYQPQLGSQEMTVTAESSVNVPFKVAIVDPNGLTLQTGDAVSGIATLSVPVNQQGVYVIKVINVSLGSLQFTTTTTPLVKR